MKQAIVTSCLLLAVWSSPAPAAAPEAVDIGLVGGLHVASPESDLLGHREVGIVMGNSAMLGIRAGYSMESFPLATQVLATTSSLTYSPGILKGTGALAVAEALYYLDAGPVRITAGGGIGALSLIAGTAGEDTDLAYTTGAGLRWTPPSSDVSIRFDGRAVFSDGTGSGLALHQVWLIGVDYTLSRHQVEVPSTARLFDEDGDGITDRDDRCPAKPGLRTLGGCPDTDRDGLADALDACPETSGLARFQGCPDTDGDSVPDTEDACPTIAGSPSESGCPDRDGDGLADSRDRCPGHAGPAQRRGCPAPTRATLALFNRPLSGIAFRGSPPALSMDDGDIVGRLVRIMDTYPDMHVQIRGHAHDRHPGHAAYADSEARAVAIVRALVAQGADPKRLSALGMGADQPIASNRNEDGRARNERVELHLLEAAN